MKLEVYQNGSESNKGHNLSREQYLDWVSSSLKA